MAEAECAFVNNKAGREKYTSSLRERKRKREAPTPLSSASNGADAPSEGGW